MHRSVIALALAAGCALVTPALPARVDVPLRIGAAATGTVSAPGGVSTSAFLITAGDKRKLSLTIKRSKGSRLTPDLRLSATLRNLRRTRPTKKLPQSSPNAARILEAFLKGMRTHSFLLTESLMITGASIHLRAHLPSAEDAEGFLGALPSLSGWSASLPEVQNLEDSTRVSIRWSRSAENGE